MQNGFHKDSGEVAAIVGYEFQYSIFATEIYNALLNDNIQIEWIEFASSSVGKIDDVLIGLSESILAFQIKNISSSNFSYSTFTTSDTQSIIEGMFLGWKNIKNQYQNKTIDVRFITTQAASTNDKIQAYIGKQKPSFQSFLNNFWQPIHEGKYNNETLPKAWRDVYQELAVLTNSTSIEIIEFIKSTQFIFEYTQPKIFDAYVENQRKIDIEEITKRIILTIAKNGNIRFNKNEFLNYFGLKNRYETYYTHSFFVDEEHYQPINETSNQLEKVLRTVDKGYIALIGNAGSGKSTLLTKWIKNNNYKVLKYYAYVNTDMNYEFGYRGEAKIFFHDLLIQIRQANLSIQERLPTENLEDLQKHFNKELNKLSYQNEKTIIIVDGLDHIEREQDVTKSLIGLLPLPENIPNNIYFILGSRTVDNLDKLNHRIKLSLNDENRIVTMEAMTKDKIHNYLSSYKIFLNEKLLEKLYINTKGHPLFLRYTIEDIKDKEVDLLDEIISQKVFSGNIYNEYEIFWEKNKDLDEFIEIVGLIARFRDAAFDIQFLYSFPKISRANLYKINKLSENYFYKIGNIWQFFHSSFKEFLIDNTAKDILTNNFDNNIDKQFHLRIANVAKTENSQYKWNIIYHLYKAEEFSIIISLVNQEYFRQQWFEYRSYKLINEDIKIAINASKRQKDVYCLFRCLLSTFEILQRYNNFTPSNYINTFHQLNKIELANSFVYDNVELLVSQKFALEYCVTLYLKHHQKLAYDIFLRATPTYILHQSKSVSPNRYDQDNYNQVDEIELICAWAKAASLFIPLEEIFSTLEQIAIEEEQHSQYRERDLFAEASSGIIEINITAKQWETLKSLETILLAKHSKYDLFYFYFDIVSKLSNENNYYTHCLQILNKWKINDNNPINRRLLIVNLLIQRKAKKSIALFNKLVHPNEVEKSNNISDNINFLNYIFDYARFFYITTKQFSTSSVTFLSNESKHTIRTFEYAFAELGKSYAFIYHNYKEAARGYYSNFDQFLKLFHYRHNEVGYEYSITDNKATFINLILKVSLELPLITFNEILERLATEWVENRIYWKTIQIQAIIEFVIDTNLNNEWCITQLEKINVHLFDYGYVDDRIERGIMQIQLWSKLNQTEKGEEILNHIMDISFDIRGEKDSQLDYIVGWINTFDSDMSSEIDYYLQRMNSLREKVNSASHTPSTELLSLALKYSNGFEVFQYLLFEGLITFNDGLESILTSLQTANSSYNKILTKLFTRVILAYDNHSVRHKFLNRLFIGTLKVSSNDLINLVKDISIYSISEFKDNYLIEIQAYAIKNNIELSSIGLNKKIDKKDRNGSTDNSKLNLENDEKVTATELISKINNIQELQKVQNNINYYGSFNWSDIYTKIFAKSSDIEIKNFIDNGKHKSIDLSEIADVLISTNRNEIAKDILYKAIERGEKYGWVEFMDGGSKIVPFKALSKIEEKKTFQTKAFDDFSSSVDSFSIQSIEILLKDIPQIWDFFSDNIDKSQLYSEIVEFRDNLLKTHSADYTVPSVNGSLNAENLLLEILFFLITIPSDFNCAIYQILFEEYLIHKNIVKQLLKKLFDNLFFAKYIQLVAVISVTHNEIIQENKDDIIFLLNNKRYDIFRIAFKLLKSIKINLTEYYKIETKELPLGYGMGFDYTPSIFNSRELEIEHIDEKGFLKETSDPFVYTKLYADQIDLLSSETGIDAINIAYRIMLLGKDLEFPNWCKVVNEEEIREIYSNKFDLEISYKRPRNQLVWDGLMKVIKELWELNLINDSIADMLSNDFDENAFSIETSAKPDFVNSILEGEYSRAPSATKGWTKLITDEYLEKVLTFKTTDDSYILAEHTIIKGMGWGYNEEIRQSFISFLPNVNSGTKRELIFNLTSMELIKDYKKLHDKGITLYNALLTINKKRNWLAINPLLCKELNLVFNPNEGNFRWDDNKGNKIIESVYWQINSTDNYSKNHDSEAGYGWYVILYKEGYNMFKQLIGDKDIYHHRKISRHMEYSQKRYNTDIKEDFSNYKSNKLIL